jgi:O-6-methylguanine DNA methyltransferase
MPATALSLAVNERSTPLGVLVWAEAGGLLYALELHGDAKALAAQVQRFYGPATLQPGAGPSTIGTALGNYFAGDMSALAAIACASAGSPFQRSVWAALRQIPAGQTRSYAAIAAQIGQPKACRAVGLANGANPHSLVVPCHRVIGASGRLTGYGGGLDRKRWLLSHEGVAVG